MPTDNQTAESDDRPPVQFRNLLRRAAAASPAFRRDLTLLFGLPLAILIILFATTDPSTFEYRVASPDLSGIYLSQLAHRSWGHLAGNLLGFLLIGGFEYCLLTATGYRTHYIALFGLTLTVVPVFSHLFLQFVLIHQPVFQTYQTVGFSGTVAVLTVSFPFALTLYCHHVSGFQLPIPTALFICAGSIGWAISQLFGVNTGAVVLVILGLFGLGSLGWHIYRPGTLSNEACGEYVYTVVWLLVVFSVVLYALFSGTQTGSMVGHLAGYFGGFLIAVGAFLIWKTISSQRNPTAIALNQ